MASPHRTSLYGCIVRRPGATPAIGLAFVLGCAAQPAVPAPATTPATAAAAPSALERPGGVTTGAREIGRAAADREAEDPDAELAASLAGARGWYLLRGPHVRVVSNAPRPLAEALLARAEAVLGDLQARQPLPGGPGRHVVRLCRTREVFQLYGGHHAELARYDPGADEIATASRDEGGDPTTADAEACLRATSELLSRLHLEALRNAPR